jgi:hypothetical protein
LALNEQFETVEVPFIAWGNYSVLTDMQIMEMPWLLDFINRFPNCFERDDMRSIYIFWPEGRPAEVVT